MIQIFVWDKEAQALPKTPNYANEATSITKPVKNTVYYTLILSAIKVSGVLQFNNFGLSVFVWNKILLGVSQCYIIKFLGLAQIEERVTCLNIISLHLAVVCHSI